MKKMPDNEVHLWLVDDQQVCDDSLLQSYQDLLSEEEFIRWQRFMFPEHKRQFLIARALVRSVLSDYAGIDKPAELVFDKNSYGKPFIVGSETSTPVQFNLSHTDGLIALAVSMNNELGVDVENLSRQVDVLKLAERYFSRQEVDDLKALDASLQQARFIDLWTLKESYIKACGKGLAIPLRDFSFKFLNNEISIAFTPALDDSPRHWRFWQFDAGVQHRLALALKGEFLEQTRLVCKRGVPLQGFILEEGG